MESFARIFNIFQPSALVAKLSILGICGKSGYTSGRRECFPENFSNSPCVQQSEIVWLLFLFTYFYSANLHYKCKCELVCKVVCLCAKLIVIKSTKKHSQIPYSREGVNSEFGKVFYPLQFFATP